MYISRNKLNLKKIAMNIVEKNMSIPKYWYGYLITKKF